MECIKCNQTMTKFNEIGRTIPNSNNIICINCSPNRIKCECGASISINSAYRHLASRKHLTYRELNHIYNNVNFKIDLN
jgi:hypothetical protein